jgi:predicted transcriptional regulator
MTLILDQATEQLLQQELAMGMYHEPLALIAHALDLVKVERSGLPARRLQMVAEVEESLKQLDGGQFVTAEQMRERMAALRSVQNISQTA